MVLPPNKIHSFFMIICIILDFICFGQCAIALPIKKNMDEGENGNPSVFA